MKIYRKQRLKRKKRKQLSKMVQETVLQKFLFRINFRYVAWNEQQNFESTAVGYGEMKRSISFRFVLIRCSFIDFL